MLFIRTNDFNQILLSIACYNFFLNQCNLYITCAIKIIKTYIISSRPNKNIVVFLLTLRIPTLNFSVYTLKLLLSISHKH